MTKLTDKEKDTVFALAVISATRRMIACKGLNTDQIEHQCDAVGNDVANIMREHLTQDQILYLAAQDLTSRIGETFKQFGLLSVAFEGSFNLDRMIPLVEQFCSEKLGTEVKL